MFSINVYFISILCVALPKIGKTAADWKRLDDGQVALANTSVMLAREHFSKASTTVVMIERSMNISSLHNKRIFDYILLNLQETMAVQLYFGQSENQPWDYHILVIDSFEAFREISCRFPRTHFERKYRFLVILTIFPKSYHRVMKEIFTLGYELRILNMYIILHHPLGGILMYSYTLFSKWRCRYVQPKLVYPFRNGFENLTQVFPKKLLNLHGCPIRITARQNSPLLTFEGDTDDPKPDGYWNNLNGIDGMLIRIISRTINFTIDLMPFPKERSYMNNDTAYGCFAELINDTADIAIGGFSASEPNRCHLSPSTYYHHSPMVLIVQNGRDLNPMSRLARPFKHHLWSMIVIVLILSIFVIEILQCVKPAIRQFIIGERNTAPIVNFLAVFLGYSITQVPRRNFARYLLLLWLLITLILRNAYQGSLYDSLRMARFVKMPMGYEDIIRWNYEILLTKEINDLEIFPQNRTVVVGDGCAVRFKTLDSKIGRYATVALRDNFLSYMEKHFRNGCELKMVQEPLFLQQTAFYFPKHSIYKSSINQVLRKFSYAGITRHIERNSIKEAKLFMQHKKNILPKRISLDQIWGMYEIYVAMMSLALLVFGLELFSVYCKKVRSFIEWIN